MKMRVISRVQYKEIADNNNLFLDPSRISQPDVDSDFEDSRRQEVIDYTIKKYGRNSVAQIITFGTLAARASLRAVGRALDYPYASYDKVAKMIPQRPGVTIKDGLDENRDLLSIYENDEKIKKLIDLAMSLEGLPTNTSTHAAGVLITDEKGVEAYTPMWKNDSGIVVQYDKDLLEDLGLLKMDFLGLKTLGVLGEAKRFISQNHGVDIDFDELYKLPTMEPLKLIKEGKTIGVFQLESPGMSKFMKELMPDTIEDVIAGISLYRPGPMAEIPRFLYNKRNPDKVVYPFPEVEEILKETYGVLTYQEQCMRAAVSVAGY
ncbi:MAG: DNA polymerase III subunit alpha, partial [Paraclostridium sp.]